MEKVFHDKYQMTCIFTDEGIIFSNVMKDVYFPYGCLDSLNLSLLGIMQAVSRAQVCCFTVAKEDKAEIKELVKRGKAAMKSSPAAEPVVLDLTPLHVDGSLPAEDQLKAYKAHYVQGVISRDQFNLKKRLLQR